MSAFITNKDLVDLLITAGLVIAGILENTPQDNADPTTVDAADQAGKMLVDANYASVNYRYNEHEEPYRYSWQPVIELTETTISPLLWLQVHEAIQCFEYQACETPDWERTEAHSYISLISEYIKTTLADWPKTPAPHQPGQHRWQGQDQCSWDWSREQGFPQGIEA